VHAVSKRCPSLVSNVPLSLNKVGKKASKIVPDKRITDIEKRCDYDEECRKYTKPKEV